MILKSFITSICINITVRNHNNSHSFYRHNNNTVVICVYTYVSVIACREKAVFLLKFAGLSRVTRDGGEEGLDEADGSPSPHPSWPRRSSRHWQKVSNAISTVGRLKQQV